MTGLGGGGSGGGLLILWGEGAGRETTKSFEHVCWLGRALMAREPVSARVQ